MERNKTIAVLIILALIIPAYAANNTSVPTTEQEQFTMGKAVETIFFIGIILSPFSFIIAVVALWTARKNRRKTYNIKIR